MKKKPKRAPQRKTRVSVAMSEFEKELSALNAQFTHVGEKLQATGTAMTNAVTLPLATLADAAKASAERFAAEMRAVDGVMRPKRAGGTAGS